MDNTSSLLKDKITDDAERNVPPGRVALFAAALLIGVLLMGIQLWLLTVALELYLAGNGGFLWLMGVISGLVFLGGLFVLRVLERHPRSPRQLPPHR